MLSAVAWTLRSSQTFAAPASRESVAVLAVAALFLGMCPATEPILGSCLTSPRAATRTLAVDCTITGSSEVPASS